MAFLRGKIDSELPRVEEPSDEDLELLHASFSQELPKGEGVWPREGLVWCHRAECQVDGKGDIVLGTVNEL